MNIIAGKYRGKRIEFPEGQDTRPTAGVVRQALFTKLQFFVPDKKVLDLFAGSGALGLEGLSRGAKEVSFVENSKDAQMYIQKNINSLKEEDQKKCRLYKGEAFSFLSSTSQKFDLILIDPPYASDLYNKCLSLIFERNLLEKEGIIVCECRKKAQLIIPSGFLVFDEKIYGIKKLIYISKNNE